MQYVVAGGRLWPLDRYIDVLFQHVLWPSNRVDLNDVSAILSTGFRHVQTLPAHAEAKVWAH